MMPFSLGRLRFGRNTTSDTLGSPQTPVGDDTKGKGNALRAGSSQRTPTPTPVSPRARFGSWLSRVRSRKERGANQPAGRPPTPTPHLMLASSSATKDTTLKTLRRVRSQTTGDLSTTKEDENNDSDDDDEEEEEEENMTDAERDRLSSFASGLRGLIAQLQLADEESRSMPPMKNTEGTPLSPISEAEELEPELDLVPQLIAKAPSVDEVTDLDYGEPFDALELEEEVEADLGEDLTPTWHPDVAELVESDTPICRRKSLPYTPSHPTAEALDNEGRVDDNAIERELGIDSELVAEDRAETEMETETEDELEYFSATSLPASSGEEDEGNKSDVTSGPGLGLRLRGLDLAGPPSANPNMSEDSFPSEMTSDDSGPLEEILSPTTPRPMPRHHLPSHPQPVTHSKVDYDPTTLKSRRQRAATLPTTRERALPALPPLSIPTVSNTEPKQGSQDVGELVRTVARLQREKARLEQTLVCANLRIEQQDGQLSSLTAQIASLRAALVRLARADTDSDSEKSIEQNIPIIVRSPHESSDSDASEEADAGLLTTASSTKDSANPLSTPPATPDRRAAAALSEDADASEECRSAEDTSLLCTPKPARGLVRRKSAGAASALSELGIGRAQVKRRAGSADLKTLTTSLPW